MKFEKDFDYYIYNAFMLLERGNVITPFDLDNDRRIGLFYIMSIYHISFATYVRGSWEWLSLVKEKGGKPLDAKEIRAMEPDIEIYNKLKEEFSRGILPGKNNEAEDIKPHTKKQREFLYNYFAEMGNMARASIYLEEGSENEN